MRRRLLGVLMTATREQRPVQDRDALDQPCAHGNGLPAHEAVVEIPKALSGFLPARSGA